MWLANWGLATPALYSTYCGIAKNSGVLLSAVIGEASKREVNATKKWVKGLRCYQERNQAARMRTGSRQKGWRAASKDES